MPKQRRQRRPPQLPTYEMLHLPVKWLNPSHIREMSAKHYRELKESILICDRNRGNKPLAVILPYELYVECQINWEVATVRADVALKIEEIARRVSDENIKAFKKSLAEFVGAKAAEKETPAEDDFETAGNGK